MANAPADDNTWIFGYGSLIWGAGPVRTLDRRIGYLDGWHREWTWISTTARCTDLQPR